MARKDSEHQKKSMSMLFRGKAIFKPLNTGRIDEHVSCVREWVANIFFYTKNGTTIMIDAGYNYARLQEKTGVIAIWDGFRSGFTFWQFFLRFVLIFTIYKICDMTLIDNFLLLKFHFFQHYYPEAAQVM